jgi:hypothetical protein
MRPHWPPGAAAAKRFAVAAACAALLALPSPVGAQIRFGADLNRPANVGYGCEAFPSTNFAGNRLFLSSGFGTCTYMGVGSAFNLAEVPQAPAEGVVTRVLVKAGPTVGPMQAVVLRSTRSGVGAACCFFAAQSQVFTPQPNAVTAVPVRLPMRKDIDVQFGETVDYLGLSVLAPGVPVPGHDEGVPGDISRNGATAWWPHVQPGDTRADGGGVGAFTPLIAGDLFPVCNPAPIRGFPSTAQQRVPCIPGVQIVDNLAVAAGAGLSVNVICNVAAPCNGDIRFQSRRVRVAGAAREAGAAGAAREAGAAGAKRITYGRIRFEAPSGGRQRARGSLTAAGRSLLSGRRRAEVYANARIDGRTISSRRVTLKRRAN